MNRDYIAGGYTFNGDELSKWNIDLYRSNIETNVFSFYIAVDSIQSIYQGLPELVQSLPEHELFNIIFYSNDPLDENRVLDILNKIDADNFFRRLHIFHEWMYGCKIRIYQVMDEYQEYTKGPDFIHDNNTDISYTYRKLSYIDQD